MNLPKLNALARRERERGKVQFYITRAGEVLDQTGQPQELSAHLDDLTEKERLYVRGVAHCPDLENDVENAVLVGRMRSARIARMGEAILAGQAPPAELVS